MFNHLKAARDVEVEAEAHSSVPVAAEDEETKVVELVKMNPLSIPEKQVEKEEEGAFPEVPENNDQKVLDDKWDKKMKRAMTISINEEEHPCWAKVDEIWEEYKLSKE